MGDKITDKLKPCPFCGGEAVIRESFGRLYIRPIHKADCFVTPDTWLISTNVSLKKQIKVWNRRTKDDG